MLNARESCANDGALLTPVVTARPTHGENVDPCCCMLLLRWRAKPQPPSPPTGDLPYYAA